MSTSVELVALTKRYSGQAAVRDLSLRVEAGEFFTLLGSSGSGKTTTLMMIAGFVDPDAGEIRVGERSILGLPPERRNLGVVFQSYALFPNMTAAENVAFPLRMRGMDRRMRGQKVAEALGLVDLAELAERRIGQLSGGQQQRVALARALVFEPPVLLMDEPLGALDRKLREQLQGEIKRIQQALGVTVIYVTHDQDEALVLSDRIAVMAGGEIVQMGPAAEVYERPKSLFVAQFLGESNVVEGRVVRAAGGGVELELSGGAGLVVAAAAAALPAGPVRLMVRPEAVSLSTERHEGLNSLAGQVRSIDYLGASIRYGISTRAGGFLARMPRLGASRVFALGAEVFVEWRPEEGVVFP